MLEAYITMAVRCTADVVDFVNCNAPDAFLKRKMHQNLLSTKDLLGELTTLRQPPP